jgi:hypothetical protein
MWVHTVKNTGYEKGPDRAVPVDDWFGPPPEEVIEFEDDE